MTIINSYNNKKQVFQRNIDGNGNSDDETGNDNDDKDKINLK